MKCRCLHRPQMTPSPDGTHTCPSCGSEVHLRDAGYERFTEMPLGFKVKDLTAVLSDVMTAVGALPLPTRAQWTDARVCQDAGRGPGCGASFLPINPTQMRCPVCTDVRWKKETDPPEKACLCGRMFAPKQIRSLRCPPCQRAYRVKQQSATSTASIKRARLRRSLDAAKGAA